jgi:choline dehydrogenase
VGYLYCIGNPRTDWLYQTEPDAGLNGRACATPRQDAGGCSSINGMIYMRGQARDYDQWAQITGDDTWRWDQVLPAFRRHEDHWRLDQPGDVNENFKRLHGNKATGSTANGVEKQRLRWDVLDAFAQAAQQAGIPATDDFNRGNNEGVGYFEVNQKKGWRWNTAKAFCAPPAMGAQLRDVDRRAGRQLLVERQPDGSCAAPACRSGRASPWSPCAPRARCCCARAQSTRRSCCSSRASARRAAAPARHRRAARSARAGANLQDHLQIRSVYKVQNVKTLNTLASSLVGKAKIGLEYALKRSGPMSMAPSQLGAFTRSSADQPWPNIEYHVQPLSLDAFGEPLHGFPPSPPACATSTPPAGARCRSRAPTSTSLRPSPPTTSAPPKTARWRPTACA